MLNWLLSFVSRWAFVVPTPIRDLVHWTVHALASVVYTVFGNVGKAWHDVWLGLRWVEHAGADYVGWVVTHLKQIVLVDIPQLYAWALTGLKRIESYALSLYKLALAGIDELRKWAAAGLEALRKWVLANVWAPLLARIRQAEADILKWAFYAYDLLTHPAKLAGILLTFLISAAESAFWTITAPAGEFALRLVLTNARRFALLAETIITAVL